MLGPKSPGYKVAVAPNLRTSFVHTESSDISSVATMTMMSLLPPFHPSRVTASCGGSCSAVAFSRSICTLLYALLVFASVVRAVIWRLRRIALGHIDGTATIVTALSVSFMTLTSSPLAPWPDKIVLSRDHSPRRLNTTLVVLLSVSLAIYGGSNGVVNRIGSGVRWSALD